jgi:hypothetical protein
MIARRLRAAGCEVAVEEERAHGGYWWPIALANALALGGAALGAVGGRRGRLLGAAAAGVAAHAVWDDLDHGRRWFRKMLLPHRPTWNVLARTGDDTAARTVLFVAHHDAAHSGLVFHPSLGRIGPRLFPRLHARSSQTVPILYAVWLGPALICAGALVGRRRLRTAGAALAAATIAAMGDIALRPVVPGANDNLAAVGVLLALAERLSESRGVRVLLLSTGSEESMSEGMQGFLARHGSELDRERTDVVCLECLGGPSLIVLGGEGMLRMRNYSLHLREALERAAAAAGAPLGGHLRTVAATDALFALRAGFSAATLASVDTTKLPLNYHWPNDVPEELHWGTVERALEVCVRFVRERATAEVAPASGCSPARPRSAERS